MDNGVKILVDDNHYLKGSIERHDTFTRIKYGQYLTPFMIDTDGETLSLIRSIHWEPLLNNTISEGDTHHIDYETVTLDTLPMPEDWSEKDKADIRSAIKKEMNLRKCENAAAYWTKHDENGNIADRQTLLNIAETLLKEHKNGVIATCSDGQARATPVDYSYENKALYIFSEGGLKFRNLEGQKVGFTIYNQDGTFGNLHSVQILGTASLTEPFSKEYNQLAELRHISLDYLKKMEHPMHLIKITPTEITVLDSDLTKQKLSSRGVITIDA